VHSLTHELKSPLAAIRGAGEILAEAPPPDIAKRFIGNINLETARMQQLIERMLQLARLESGQGLDRQSVEPARLQRGGSTPARSRPSAVRSPCTPSWGKVRSRSGIPCWWSRPWATCWTTPSIRPRRHTRLSGAMEEGGYCFRVRDQGPGIPDFALPGFSSVSTPCQGQTREKAAASGSVLPWRWHASMAAILLLPISRTGVLATLWLPGN
jgi:two-component system sensor histidine kinase CreC